MKEQEIIQSADSVKQLKAYFNSADQFLDMRRWYWRVGSTWIDIAFTEQFKRPKILDLVLMFEGGPETYVEYENVTLATIDKDGIEYLCIFDNELKRGY